MLDTATRTPDSDATSSAGTPPTADRAPLPRPRPDGATSGDGKAADAAWLDSARREAAHIEYDCQFHAEAHFECCARWGRWNTVFGVLPAVLGALTASTIATVLGDAGMVPGTATAAGAAASGPGGLPAWLVPYIALGALVAGVVAAAVRFLDPQGRAAQHGAAGKRYRALGDEARQFRNLEATADATRDELFNHLRTMIRHRAEIHEAAPVIPKPAYAATRAKAGGNDLLKKLAVESGRVPA